MSYVVTEQMRAEARKRLWKAFRNGYRRKSGQHLDKDWAYRMVDQVMDALPQIYGVGEHPDIVLDVKFEPTIPLMRRVGATKVMECVMCGEQFDEMQLIAQSSLPTAA